MRRRRFTTAVCLCGLALTGGCTWPQADPAARRETPPQDQSDEPPLLVEKPVAAEPPADDDALDQRILDYVSNIDSIARRVKPRADNPAFEEPPLMVADATRMPLGTLRDAPEDVAGPAAALPGPPPPRGGSDRADASSASAVAPSEALPDPTPVNAPVLASVSVRAERRAAPPSPAEAAGSPSVNAPASASGAPLSLKQLVEQWIRRSQDTSFQSQLDARLLRAAAGDYERARQPLELVSDEQQQMAARFVEAYIALRQATLGDGPDEAAAALREIERLADSLRPLSGLSIPTLAICRAVRGFGQYDPLEPASFAAGVANEFVLYCEVRDFTTKQDADGQFEARFDMRTSILTRAGTRVLEIDDRDLVDRCRTRRRDCFIPRLVRLPATLSPGEYVAKVTLVDKLGDKVAEKRVTFRVTARP